MTAGRSMFDLRRGDCLDILPKLAAGSVDAVITDPPYPEISRPYGRMPEAEWHSMMNAVVAECRRVLKPTGSAVFILQPNSERVGRMRPWLWEFMAKWCREWGMVEDAYWWNISATPTIHCQRKRGLMRPSVKPCVWLGEPDAYRNQDAVLWTQSDSNRAKNRADRALQYSPSGLSMRVGRCVAVADERGGSTPFNLLPIANSNSTDSAGSHGHGAGTPRPLCDWWVRYISPPGGVVLDPFSGSGTVGLAALSLGRSFVGIDRDPGYCATARRRLKAAEKASAAA